MSCCVTEEVRQKLSGVEPPDMSAERIHRYALNPETYLTGEAEDAAKLMDIFVERIDANDRNAVITYRLSDLTAAAHSTKAVALQPVS